jgi:hypothetical protein
VAAGSYEGALQCYRAKDCKALQSVEAHEGPVKALAASTEGGEWLGGGVYGQKATLQAFDGRPADCSPRASREQGMRGW